jgi:2-keto-4-pentenoate hydratase/2-oxohepta-3-ene-1,7-dioic acid hydratase in catechol pathway
VLAQEREMAELPDPGPEVRVDGERIAVHAVVHLVDNPGRPRDPHRSPKTWLVGRVVEHPSTGVDRPRPDLSQFVRALDLQPDVIKAGRLGGDQLQLVVLLVRGQQRFTVRPRPHTEAEDALDMPNRTLQVADTQGNMADMHPHGSLSRRGAECIMYHARSRQTLLIHAQCIFMAIIRYSSPNGAALGVVLGDEVAPFDVALDAGAGVEAVLAAGTSRTQELIERARRARSRLPLADLEVLAPVPRPSKIFAVGLNYADHIAEAGAPIPETPTIFAKYPNTVVGPRDPIQRPRVSDELDYEGELAVVIGQRCRHVPPERAADVIGGYFVLNDVTVRDWQKMSPQWTMSKSFDTHAPTGPWLTLPDAVDPLNLGLRTLVNGELRQESNTCELVRGPQDLIAFISQACTLEPGDVIATGTPGGVGFFMDPPRYLAPGDEVRVEIDGLGTLVNPVVDEPSDGAHIGEERLGEAFVAP